MPRVPPSTDDLAGAELEWQRALLASDADALEAILDDEAEVHGIGGRSRAKDELVEAVRLGRLRSTAFDVERTRARVVGELGITHTWARVAGTDHGAAFDRRIRATRTWRLGEHWMLVASNESEQPAGAAASG